MTREPPKFHPPSSDLLRKSQGVRVRCTPGDAVTLAAVLLVDGDDLVTDAAKLASVAVSGEIAEHTKGPKIRIHKFKNKTGYHKRQGHRQPLTRVKVTGISSGK
jgi:large subunit ribosomal protein L21